MLGPQKPSRKPRALGRRRPGPVPGFDNPSPVGDGIDEPRIDWISPEILDDTEQRLRQYLLARRKELARRPRESFDDAAIRIATLAQRAVEETEAAWWSRRVLYDKKESLEPRRDVPSWRWNRTRNHFWAKPHVGPTPPAKRPAHNSPWLDASIEPFVLRLWNKNTKSWKALFEVSAAFARDPEALFEWAWQLTLPVVLPRPPWPAGRSALIPTARTLVSGKLGRAGKSGRPAFLACAILGGLLKVSPKRVADTLNHYRRTRQTRPAL
jgi:hypothetical protein